ncbi:helix-turn-helix domain-containing protein [Streptomyces hebeiensis]|uniref:Helix-turn-helix domain-containing protein n=1 Tax=Streptomyces hebeiensis TaxID=229486 RepID=A0ABN1UXJ1_9ACTN
MNGGQGRTFFADVTAPNAARHGFDTFRRGWEAQVGEGFPLPVFTPGADGGFRVSARASKVDDAVIADLYSEAFSGHTGGVRDHFQDRVLMHVLRRGRWHFARPDDHGHLTVPAGQFIVRHNGPPARFEVLPRTRAKVLILPASLIRPLIGDRQVVGPADSATMRMLMAHAHMVDKTLHDLTPAGVEAARDALIELAKGVLKQEFDGTEPRLATALAQAAKDLADRRLADPHLSPTMLAGELNVSVRTLYRAFATTEESVTGYVRRRRLEQARLALTAAVGRPSISELAAHWQFADSSHFIRAFKKQYGRTPADYARSNGPTGPSATGS